MHEVIRIAHSSNLSFLPKMPNHAATLTSSKDLPLDFFKFGTELTSGLTVVQRIGESATPIKLRRAPCGRSLALPVRENALRNAFREDGSALGLWARRGYDEASWAETRSGGAQPRTARTSGAHVVRRRRVHRCVRAARASASVQQRPRLPECSGFDLAGFAPDRWFLIGWLGDKCPSTSQIFL